MFSTAAKLLAIGHPKKCMKTNYYQQLKWRIVLYRHSIRGREDRTDSSSIAKGEDSSGIDYELTQELLQTPLVLIDTAGLSLVRSQMQKAVQKLILVKLI